MKCGYSYDELTAYFDGELTREEDRKLQQHLACCRECAAVLEEFRFIRSAVLSAWQEEMPAPDDLRSGVLDRLKKEGAFRENPPAGTPLTAKSRWKLLKGWGFAAAASALLVAGASWAWLSGGLGVAPPETALVDNKPAVTEQIPAKQGGVDKAPEQAANTGTDAKPENKPGEQSQEKAVSPPEKAPDPPRVNKPAGQTGTAPETLKDIAGTAFLSVDKDSCSGYFQLKESWESFAYLDQKIRLTAAKYNATLAGGFNDGGGVVKINVPTADYDALYGELKEFLSGNGILAGSGNTRESLDKQYREVLTELEQVRVGYEAAAGDTEKQKQLAARENSLLDRKEDLEKRARTATIVLKL